MASMVMDLLSESIFCATTVKGQLGATLIQFSIWALITNYSYGVMAYFERYAMRQPWYRNCQVNYKDDDAQEIYQFPDPGFNYVTFFQTVIHHGGGGLLMLTGMLTGQAWIWRHGMLVEVGGMDLLDFYKIAHAKLFPPGTRPTSLMMKSAMFIPLSVFHHMVGICVGIPVNLYFSEVFKFQLFGLMILGAPAISLLPGLFIKTKDVTEHPRLLIANQLWLFTTFAVVQRTLYYFPAAWDCFAHVMNSEVYCWQIMVPFAWALFSMSAFNLVVTGILTAGTYKMLTAKDEDHTLRRQISNQGIGVADAAIRVVMLQRNMTGFVVTSKMIAKARKAKEAVKMRSESEAAKKRSDTPLKDATNSSSGTCISTAATDGKEEKAD